MNWMQTVMGLVVAGIFIVLADSIMQEYKRADAKTLKLLNKQYLGIGIGCLIVFTLAITVFKPQMARVYNELVKIENPGVYQNQPAANNNTDWLLRVSENQSAMGLFRQQ